MTKRTSNTPERRSGAYPENQQYRKKQASARPNPERAQYRSADGRSSQGRRSTQPLHEEYNSEIYRRSAQNSRNSQYRSSQSYRSPQGSQYRSAQTGRASQQRPRRRPENAATVRSRSAAPGSTYYYRTPQSKKQKQRRSRALMIILPIIFVLLAFIAFITVNVVSAKNHASAVKSSLKEVLACVQDKDPESAEAALEKAREETQILTKTFDNGFWKAASGIDRVNQEIQTGKALMSVVTDAEDIILVPLIDLMKKEPLSNLKVGEGGFNVRLINKYLDFFEEIQPDLEHIMEEIEQVDPDSLVGGMVGDYKDTLYKATGTYKEASSLLPLLRTILGGGEDRLYLLVAQNSAEIRASGGFPGSIGTISIYDGVLEIGNFESVYYLMANSISYASGVTEDDLNYFNAWVYAPRDACFIPAFDKAAKIWATGFEDKQRELGATDRDGYWDEVFSSPGFNQVIVTPADYWNSFSNEPVVNHEDNEDDEKTPDGDVNIIHNPDEEGGNGSGEDGGMNNDSGEDGGMNDGGMEDGGDTGNDLTLNTIPGASFMKTAPPSGPIAAAQSPEELLTEDAVVSLMDEEVQDHIDGPVRYVDGVVSLTPAIIQMLLKYTGEITLSDGTVLNGDNATRVLQYELYHKYFDEDTLEWTSNGTADELFAETAKMVMKEFVSAFEVSKIADFYEMFKEGIEKNVIQIWMADEAEEDVIEEAGCSGKLNFEADKPEAGVFFSLSDPSKLGWYLDIDTSLSEPTTNSDGSQTYHMTVTLTNTMSEADARKSSWYIIGSYNGTITGYLHCFAPFGGTIENARTSNWLDMYSGEYMGLEVFYTQFISVDPGDSFTVSYDITTAPHINTPLKVRTTPTLSEYR